MVVAKVTFNQTLTGHEDFRVFCNLIGCSDMCKQQHAPGGEIFSIELLLLFLSLKLLFEPQVISTPFSDIELSQVVVSELP